MSPPAVVTRRRPKFTAIELVVVVTIIAILAGLTFPILSSARVAAWYTAAQHARLVSGQFVAGPFASDCLPCWGLATLPDGRRVVTHGPTSAYLTIELSDLSRFDLNTFIGSRPAKAKQLGAVQVSVVYASPGGPAEAVLWSPNHFDVVVFQIHSPRAKQVPETELLDLISTLKWK